MVTPGALHSLPGNGMSWIVPVFVLNIIHTRLGLVDTEEPPPPMNASPHPPALPYLTIMQQYYHEVEQFNQQHADGNWNAGHLMQCQR